MSRRRAAILAAWISLQALATASNNRGPQERSCLTAVTPYAAHQRKNVTVDGVNEPLRIGHGKDNVPRAVSSLAKILIEELFGIHVEQVPFPDSIDALRAVSGCKSPDASTTEGAGCEVPGPAPAHIAMSVWHSAHIDSFLGWLKTNQPAQYPISLGDEGYSTRSGLIVMESVVAPAMREDHLPLDYYISYSNPRVNLSAYFDSPSSIPSRDLRDLAPCSRSAMSSTPDAKLYLAATGDAAGLSPRGDAFACAGGRWWLAPACRADASRCIATLASAKGDAFVSIAQRAARWGMPLALAAPNGMGVMSLTRNYRMLVSTVFPGATAMFRDLNYSWVQFPPHDPEEWAAGVLSSEHPWVYIGKWASSGMSNRTNDGTARVLAFMRNFRISAKQIEAFVANMLKAGLLGRGGKAAAVESLMCDWANEHASIWQSWIAPETTCLDGQGLINETGGFVDNRTRATSCAWCPPGRISAQLRDFDGVTYQCRECQPGRSQAAIGMIECEPCAAGTEAPSAGMAACTRCGLAEYAMAEGMVRCSACPQGFVTSFEGAESMDACVCAAGEYRDGGRRDRCLACEVGMACPVGSDALGLYPEHRSQYPVAPELKLGFWSSAADPLSVFRCEDALRCRGGPPGALCYDRLGGQSCQHCSQGFFWNGETCQQCSTSVIAYVVFPALPCIILPIVIVGLYRLTGDGYGKWDSWRNCVMTMLFLVLHHYQMMQVIYRTDTSFTEPANEAMRRFSWARDLLSVFNLGCYGFQSFSGKLILHSLGPMLVVVFYVVVWSASQLVGRFYPTVKMEGNRTLSGFFSIILAFFTGIADTALTVFKCARNPNGKYSLVADRSIICFEDEWNGLLAVGIVSVLVWCGGMMLVCIYAISTAPSQFHRPGIQARWKFLFIRYRADVHWWALVIVIKGIVINLSCVVLSVGLGQVTWIVVTLLGYVHLTSCYRPWRGVLNNVVDIDTHLNLVLAAASMYLFPPQDSWSSKILGETLVQVCNYIPPAACLPFAVLIYIMKGSSWARSKKATDLALLTESVHILAADDQRLLAFLQGLAESDWLVMVKAKDLVQTELASRKSRVGYRGSVGEALASGPSGQQHEPETDATKEPAAVQDAAAPTGGEPSPRSEPDDDASSTCSF